VIVNANVAESREYVMPRVPAATVPRSGSRILAGGESKTLKARCSIPSRVAESEYTGLAMEPVIIWIRSGAHPANDRGRDVHDGRRLPGASINLNSLDPPHDLKTRPAV
jgi:hypothetical protein